MRLAQRRELEEASRAGGATRDDVQERVRRFATLRAAQRALAPSSREPMSTADLEAFRLIREQLHRLVERFDGSGPAGPGDLGQGQEDLVSLDRSIEAYASLLLAKLEAVSVTQLRASLSGDSDAERVEALALLEICIDAEAVPARFLHVVDFVVTLLSTTQRDGVWMLESDPANLSEVLRRRCWEVGSCGPGTEAGIAQRFQRGAEQLARNQGNTEILAEMAAYKQEIAGFFFVPAVLRCIVGYNVVAKNHFERQLARSRELDSAIDAEMPNLGDLDAPSQTESAAAAPGRLQAHEAPGVLAVQEAIQQRLLGSEQGGGAAARVAARLDLEWLEPLEREAFIHPENDDVRRVVRMTVVLGHLAVTLPESEAEFATLGIHEAQLDAWICALGDDVQGQINALIREDYGEAQRLGDTKSRFLQAVLLVARRRHDESRKRFTGTEGADFFGRDAIAIVREYMERAQLEKRPPMFFDLLGGGWRRSAAFAAVGLLLVGVGIVNYEPRPPRAVNEFSEHQARSVSLMLSAAYRDHAEQGSMFVAIVEDQWKQLGSHEQRTAAERIRTRLSEEGVEEILLFDADRVLVAHYKDGWRTPSGWSN